MKAFLLHKLTLRVGYIIAAFSSAHLVALSTSAPVQAMLAQAGVTFIVHDPEKLKVWISGMVLVGGEFVYRWLHTKFILPKVKPA